MKITFADHQTYRVTLDPNRLFTYSRRQKDVPPALAKLYSMLGLLDDIETDGQVLKPFWLWQFVNYAHDHYLMSTVDCCEGLMELARSGHLVLRRESNINTDEDFAELSGEAAAARLMEEAMTLSEIEWGLI
jgi:hypothetical protein